MKSSNNIVQGEGNVVAQPATGRLFVTAPEGSYALDDHLSQLINSGDSVNYEAVFGDQFAKPLTVNGRRLSWV